MAKPVTEADWLACTDNLELVLKVGRLGLATKKSGGHRRLRLYAVACCRRIIDQLDDAGRAALEVAEAQADRSRPDRAALEAAAAAFPPRLDKRWNPVRTAIRAVVNPDVWGAAQLVRNAASAVALREAGGLWPAEDSVRFHTLSQVEAGIQCDIMRDIFNPFHPVTFVPAWRTPTVLGLARGIYEERAFDRLPILGDALEEAGCAEEVVLAHCRGTGIHARGCWVVDGVMGKK